MLILRPLAPASLSSFLDSSLRLTLRLALLSLPSFHFLALLPKDQLLEPQQRDLLLLQQAHHIEQGPQEPSDHSLILLAQCGLLDFLDQGLDFGRIDFGYLVVRFSHSSHTSVLRGTIAGRFFSMHGAELSPSFCPHHFSNSRAFAEALHRISSGCWSSATLFSFNLGWGILSLYFLFFEACSAKRVFSLSI